MRVPRSALAQRHLHRLTAPGQSLVEFALILPVLLLIFLGLFDFGRAIFAFNAVAEGARIGARVAIVNQTTADICAVTANRGTGLDLPTACAATSTAIGVYPTSSCAVMKINCDETVQVTYRFQPITPVVAQILGPITLRSSSTVKVERTCPPLNPGEAACPLP